MLNLMKLRNLHWTRSSCLQASAVCRGSQTTEQYSKIVLTSARKIAFRELDSLRRSLAILLIKPKTLSALQVILSI